MNWRAIYNSWTPGESWQKLWSKKRPAPESKTGFVPKAPELPELPELPESEQQLPEANVSQPVNVADLQNSILVLRRERDDLKAALDRKTFLYDALKRSLAIAPAAEIIKTPAVAEQTSLIDIFNSMPQGAAKSAFYQRHQTQLLPHIATKPKA